MSKHCDKCNSILDDYEVGTCKACSVCPLSDDELRRIAELTEKLENQTMADTGMFRLSGGFARADMFNYDETTIDIELKWGIEGESCNTEQFTIDRTDEIEDWEVDAA